MACVSGAEMRACGVSAQSGVAGPMDDLRNWLRQGLSVCRYRSPSDDDFSQQQNHEWSDHMKTASSNDMNHQVTEYVRVHLGEIARSAADGIPVVASQKHQVMIWFRMPTSMSRFTSHANVAEIEDAERKRRGMNPAEPFEEVAPPVPSLYLESIRLSSDEKIRKPEMVKNTSTPKNPP